MSEGISERRMSEERERTILTRLKAEDPETYEVLFGGTAPKRLYPTQEELRRARGFERGQVRIDVDGDVTPSDEWTIVGIDALEQLKADKETAERALLKTWYDRRFDWCAVCSGRGVNQKPENVRHTPDCAIPPLIKRYEES